jgi:hypothetical protein
MPVFLSLLGLVLLVGVVGAYGPFGIGDKYRHGGIGITIIIVLGLAGLQLAGWL